MLEVGPHGGVGGHAVELVEALLRGLREKASQLIRSPLRACASGLYETGLDFPEGDTQKRTDHDNDDRRDEERHTPSKGISGPRSHRRTFQRQRGALLRNVFLGIGLAAARQ